MKPAIKKSPEFKKLCKKYGVDHNKVIEITSVKAAYQQTGESMKLRPIVKHLPAHRRNGVLAKYDLDIVVQAFNEGKKPDYTNYSEDKYEPWFEVLTDAKKPYGKGLVYYYYYGWDSRTNVGPRLCFRNRDSMVFCAKHFIKLYEQALLFP